MVQITSHNGQAVIGKLVYLIGASGSGKDSILSTLRQQLDQMSNVIVTHRYITRHWQAGNENHIELSKAEFVQRQQLNLFAMHWHANNKHYGIGHEVDEWLAQGLIVVMNGSREYLPTAIELYGETLAPVLITVNDSILRQRLLNRGRELITDIDARLKRSKEKQTNNTALMTCHRIENNTKVDDAVVALRAYLNSLNDGI